MSITFVRSGAVALALVLAAFISLPSFAQADTNLITNPSVETAEPTDSTVPQGWNKSSFGTNVSTFTYPAVGTDGAKAIQVDMSGIALDSGANWYFNSVPVTAGQTYFFTEKYKASVATEVDVRYTIASSTPGANCTTTEAGTPAGHCYQYGWVATVAAPASATTWNTLSTASIVPPAGTDAMTVFHILPSQGSLTTDAYSLTSSNPNSLSQGFATLSFDDGWQSQFDNKSVLGTLKATFYIITGVHGSNVNDAANPEGGYMSLAEIQQLQTEGHDIGAHTRTHPVGGLTSTTTAGVTWEVNGSRQDLLTHAITPVNNFAYPEGVTNSTIQAAVTSAGFTGARGIDEGFNDKTTNPNDLFAYEIYSDTPLSFVQNLVQEAINTHTWVIFFFHQVTTTCTGAAQECITPANLQIMTTYLASQPAGTVITVSQGLAQMGLTPPAPVIAPHADVFADATSTNTTTVVTYNNPTVTPTGTVSCTPVSGSIFSSVATTTVTCTSAGAAPTTFGVGVHLHVAPAANSVATSTYPGVATPVTLKATGTGTLTFSVVASPKFGTLSGSGANQIYTPQASTTGFVDTFTFKVNDGQVDSNIATATITVSLAPDVTAPNVSDITVSPINQNDATITWTTNEAATSQVKYGTTTSYSASTTPDTTKVTTRSIQITGLDTATAYHFVVISKDAAGNATTSADQTFTTASAPVVVTPPTGGGGCSGCGCGGCGGGGGGGIVTGLIGTVNNQAGQVLGASTQVLTDAQIAAILGLLKSFDADQSVIDKVSAALHGQGVASGKYTFTLTLVLGSKNADVTALQNLLTTMGIYKGPVTGTFGPLTSAAVKIYQAQNGISQTGTVGPLTRASLNK